MFLKLEDCIYSFIFTPVFKDKMIVVLSWHQDNALDFEMRWEHLNDKVYYGTKTNKTIRCLRKVLYWGKAKMPVVIIVHLWYKNVNKGSHKCFQYFKCIDLIFNYWSNYG